MNSKKDFFLNRVFLSEVHCANLASFVKCNTYEAAEGSL
jgi:hypothetical protein